METGVRSGLGKSTEDVLREEFLQERACVLGRAGRSVEDAFEKLTKVEILIKKLYGRYCHFEGENGGGRHNDREVARLRKQRIREINEQIDRYNVLREYAKRRFYYLIVTREAMGILRHDRLEETYVLPPHKTYLRV